MVKKLFDIYKKVSTILEENKLNIVLKKQEKIKPNHSSIVIVLLGGLGDSILALDLLESMNRHISILTYREHFPLFIKHLKNITLIEFEPEKNYKIRNSEIVLLKSNQKFKDWIIKGGGENNYIKINPIFDGISLINRLAFLLNNDKKIKFFSRKHIKQHYADMLGIKVDRESVNKIVKDSEISKIGIHVSGSVGLRELKLEFINELICTFKDKKIYLFGSREDVKKYPTTGEKNVINMIGKINLPELSTILSNMDLVICPDSMIMHYCDYLNIPVIALMGNSLPQMYGPFHQSKHVITRNMPCSPCSQSRCSKLNGHSCVQDINAAEVTSKIRELSTNDYII